MANSTIYNEGRVVGYSAYEVYVRHALSVDPNTQPASELEWLSSSIAMGTSMILRINGEPASVSGHHFQEIELPENSNIAAANTIIGSLFLGEVAVDASGRWATKVTSYGPLIENNAEHPVIGDQNPHGWSTYPNSVTTPLNSTYQQNLKDYMKVVDGIIVQPGSWKASTSGTPPKDFYNPRFDGQPRVRILLSGRVVYPFYILLTGFTLKAVLKGVTGMNGSTSTAMPQDGDFLGPAVYPWANKIVFSVPPAYLNYYEDSRYTRALNSSPISVNRPPVIDMEATDPATYYSSNYTLNPVAFTVTESNDTNGDAVLTVYQRDSILPPAIYGTKVDAAGNYKLNALDTVAPGTVKIFEDANSQNEAAAVNNIQGNIGMYRDSDFIIHQTVPQTTIPATDPISDTYVTELEADRLGQRPFAVQNISGKKSSLTISLEDTLGQMLPRTGIHPYAFDSSFVFKKDENLSNHLSAVSTEPNSWETTCISYYWELQSYWIGDGTTTTFTISSSTIPDTLKGVAVDDYLQQGWSYSSGTITFNTAPALGAVITAYILPATFETISPLHAIGDEPFLKRTGTLHWDDLLYALANNKAIDLFDNEYFLARVAAVTPVSDVTIVPGTGINIIPDPNDPTLRTLSTKVNSAKGMASDSNGLYANVQGGVGIDVTYHNAQPGVSLGYVEVKNSLADISSLPTLKPGDFTISYDSLSAGCCGKFENTYTNPNWPGLIIRYSAASAGGGAGLYISTNPDNHLKCPSFKRDIKTSVWGLGFWFRHTYTDNDRLKASRILKISLNFDNVYNGQTLAARLGLTSISSVSDTSENCTGIWNVLKTSDNETCGASWQATCKLEIDPSDSTQSSLFLYGASYADGYNEQIGKNINNHDDGTGLKSDHINIKVSAVIS